MTIRQYRPKNRVVSSANFRARWAPKIQWGVDGRGWAITRISDGATVGWVAGSAVSARLHLAKCERDFATKLMEVD
jgi:hypothetical protein